jgi:predicted Zn finger-like uncharacterized protein
MYTRCPSCQSTFRVTAAVLQMAEGDVRCGSCGVVFNALQTLIDDWSDAELTGIAPDDGPSADPAPDGPPEAPPAKAPSPIDTLEFDVPENEWQRYFITPPEREAPRPGAATDAQPVPEEDADPGARSLEEETSDTDTWQAFLREAAEEPEPPVPAIAGPDDNDEADDDDEPLFVVGDDTAEHQQIQVLVRRPVLPEEPEALVDDPDPPQATESMDEVDFDDVGVAARGEEPGGESPDDAEAARRPLADSVLDWGPAPAFPERLVRAPSHSGWWLAASAVAVLVLAVQGIHYYRDRLAATPAYGDLVRAAYARLGLPLAPDWPLEAYEIRGAKAIAENSAPGALDIVAEIAVTGTQPVGLPMVRVVLRDRWSNAVGSGVFAPADYLAERPPSSGVYPPGTLIPVEISVKDPGSAAQGYELDVCVPHRQLGLQCKTTRNPFRR